MQTHSGTNACLRLDTHLSLALILGVFMSFNSGSQKHRDTHELYRHYTHISVGACMQGSLRNRLAVLIRVSRELYKILSHPLYETPSLDWGG